MKSRQEKTTPPFTLILEDADSIACSAIQEALADPEVGTILISSHPAALGGKILSQIQTLIIGKTVDQQDLAYLNNMIYGAAEEPLPGLGVGEWVVTGLNIVRPIKIRVR